MIVRTLSQGKNGALGNEATEIRGTVVCIQRSKCLYRLIMAFAMFATAAPMACGAVGEQGNDGAMDQVELGEVEQAVIPSGKVIGTWCQQSAYQTTSLMTPPGPWLQPFSCHEAVAFSGNFTSITTSFTINVLSWPAKPNLESTLDHLTNELVDLAFFEGHSGYSFADTVDFGMYEDGIADPNKRAFSKNMALGHVGPNQRGLSVFAAYSCNTVDFAGNPAWGANGSWGADWRPAFNPGLRMMLGSNKLTYVGYNGAVGKKFAQRLTAGDTFKNAWTTALDANSYNTGAAFIASGSSADECWARLESMSWANFDSKVRRVNPAWLCVATMIL